MKGVVSLVSRRRLRRRRHKRDLPRCLSSAHCSWSSRCCLCFHNVIPHKWRFATVFPVGGILYYDHENGLIAAVDNTVPTHIIVYYIYHVNTMVFLRLPYTRPETTCSLHARKVGEFKFEFIGNPEPIDAEILQKFTIE